MDGNVSYCEGGLPNYSAETPKLGESDGHRFASSIFRL
jgi:hypothetical protein